MLLTLLGPQDPDSGHNSQDSSSNSESEPDSTTSDEDDEMTPAAKADAKAKAKAKAKLKPLEPVDLETDYARSLLEKRTKVDPNEKLYISPAQAREHLVGGLVLKGVDGG